MASPGPRKRVKPSPQSPDISSPNSKASSRKSPWYPNVWPSKAAPVTEVARESISMAKHTPSDAASVSTLQLGSPKQQRHPSLQLTKRAGGSTRSLPATATTTRINIASDGSTLAPAEELRPDPTSPDTPSQGKAADTTDKEASKDTIAIETDNSEVSQKQSDPGGAPTDSGNPNAAITQPSGWLSWVYAPFTYDKVPSSNPAEPTTDQPPEQPPEPETSTADQPLKQDDDSAPPDPSPEQQDKSPEVEEITSTSQKRSWLQMWYGSYSSKGPEEPKDAAPTNAEEQVSPASFPPSGPEEAPEPTETQVGTDTPKSTATGIKPSAWSFFFGDSAQGRPETQAAEATIIQDSSPELSNSVSDSTGGQKTEVTKKGKIKSPPSGPSVPEAAMSKPANVPEAPAPAAPEASKQLQKIIPNQVLPAFKDTFALQDRPTLLQSLGRFLHYNKESSNKHVYKSAYPPRIKKALAIGIHGYFPAPLIRSVLGQPTGTSVRFSTMAAEAIRKYTEDQGYTCEIEKIALEGEGRIADRVDLLWKLLLNWMEEIRSADFILIACHSQGVPVGLMLVAKLISFGCINANRVGVCAMAGVNLGPFPDYRSRWISGSAGELFEFALPYSQVSKDYESALRTCIDFGVRISYIGSIDDQLVSLESSLFSPVSHPYIYRASFVDGRVHAPSFVSHLVGFALKLRNLGISDHGLIRELSSPLAGSLYTGEGHSRLYDDEAVYRLAIEFALETSPVSNAPLHIKREFPPPVSNPYILPFAMRGLLEEEYVRNELYNETMELLKQFDDWKPTSKVLKDVKFRLEGIRSKL
ncbi:uncharacterized protein DSM5745_10085 [Aspergillus mulundensis]|uniref:YMC020W-like alpha/beta hydrolase domain-containing protein n=1 Tax=Aspergillus mulundensis TaxID=1810919 RepID=A0A3D8QNE0_9EURO|nr:Uncharacterized protein DSM5745_10085 [Aspergillus mulundensis]RDW62974.1 Uncharacterized protein DSM5745_10085 [Aspergillus mulundensis]